MFGSYWQYLDAGQVHISIFVMGSFVQSYPESDVCMVSGSLACFSPDNFTLLHRWMLGYALLVSTLLYYIGEC